MSIGLTQIVREISLLLRRVVFVHFSDTVAAACHGAVAAADPGRRAWLAFLAWLAAWRRVFPEVAQWGIVKFLTIRDETSQHRKNKKDPKIEKYLLTREISRSIVMT